MNTEEVEPKIENYITKDTLILVHYVNIEGLTRQQAEQQLYQYSKNITHSKDVKNYIIPVYHDGRIDCINPKYIFGDEYKQLIERLEKAVSNIENKK